ncbi:MAG: guanylate kinase [Bacteroidia bacterium]|nr:guanylate kinase [Bacteroidia bacterium]MDG2041867.1 guanylate kinase [Bacteroidia bacterium]
MLNNKLVIFSAPSGSGKTTVVKHLLKKIDSLAFSVSVTTRQKRPNEENGRDYYFYSENEFLKAIKNDLFLEYEEVYKGLFYGTLKSEVERLWEAGKTVIFDVDVIGGLNIKKFYGAQALAVFLRPPSVDILMERLRNRETEVEHQLLERIEKAKSELNYEHQFDKVIVNDVLNDTFETAEIIVAKFLKSED